MKKLTLLLATAAISVSAYAVDSYQLHGQITGNSNWESVPLTENNGKWEFTGNFVKGEFGIKPMTNNNQDGWIAAPKGGATTVSEANHAYSTASSNTVNFNSTLDGNYTFSFDPAANTVTFIPYSGVIDETVTYAIHGQITGNESWASTDMIENADGSWSVNLNAVAGDFGIKRMVNGAQKDWYAADGANAVNAPGDYKAKVNGTNWKSTLVGEYTFTFNPSTLTLTVTGGGDDPNPPTPPTPPVVDYTTWYVNVIGVFNDWTDNGVQPNAEGIAVHEGLKLGTGAFRIKCWDGTADLNFSTGSTVAVGEWVKLTDTTGAGMTIANGTEDAIYNVEFNCATNEVKITLVGGDDPNPPTPPTPPADDYTTWYFNVPGEYNNWIPEGVAFNEDGTAESGDLNIGTGEFEIKVWDGKADTYYAYTENNGVVAVGQEYVLTPNTGAHMTIEGAKADSNYKVFFNVETKTMKISVGTGVESIEVESGEAVYFNLQGQRVENPANGLFVRVLNGKATKVMVK